MAAYSEISVLEEAPSGDDNLQQTAGDTAPSTTEVTALKSRPQAMEPAEAELAAREAELAVRQAELRFREQEVALATRERLVRAKEAELAAWEQRLQQLEATEQRFLEQEARQRAGGAAAAPAVSASLEGSRAEAVSYTHLTLPTNREV